jgi:hypothetical protein
MPYTALPATVPQYATDTGSNVLTGLTATAAQWQRNTTSGGATWGEIRFTFSGSPDLSTVIVGHKLNVTTGFANAENKVSGAYITAVNNASDWVEVKSFERTDATLDETGVSATSTTITTSAARIIEPSTAQKGQGLLSPQKPSDGVLNWLFYWTYKWLYMLQQNYPTGYKLGPELTAGTGITLADNGDNTKLISVSLTTAQAVQLSVSQTAHGFAVKDAVRYSGGTWAKTTGNTRAGCTDVWVVTAVASANAFTATKSGRVTLTGHLLTADTTYYLSADTAGLLTLTQPVGNTSRPLGYYLPVLRVIDANTVDILGTGSALFNPLYAEFISSASGGELVNTKSFSNFNLNNVGNRIRLELSCRNEHVSGGAAQVEMKFGNIASATDYTWMWQRSTAGAAWTSGSDASDDALLLAVNHTTSDDTPLVMSGLLQRAMGSANTSPTVDRWIYTGDFTCYDSSNPPSRGVVGGQTTGSTNITSVSFASSNGNAELMAGDYIRFYIDRMPDA